MTSQIIGTPLGPTVSQTTHTVTVPTGVTSDMVGLIAFGTGSSTSQSTVSMSGPGGSTVTRLDARAATNMYVGVFKVTGVVAGNTLTLTLATSENLYLHHYYQNAYDFVNASIAPGVRSGSAATVTSGSVSATSGDNLVVIGLERTLADGTTVTSITSSGGETISQIAYSQTDAIPDVSVLFGSLTASATASRAATVTYRDASGNGYAAVIRTTPIVPPAPVGKPIHYVKSDGTLGSASAFYTSSTGVISVPNEVRAVPTGYSSVTAMLATSPFYVAHRGGSRNWPEMSLHAYTQSVFWGVGALELSLSRTSDGVWFGLHDATLDRTSGTSNFNPLTHTWAEVQAYSISSSVTAYPSQPARPYMRWEELIAAYYPSHVIFVDPKMAASYRLELLDMMDQLPGTPTDHFVAKYYGVSGGWPLDAKARGYKTWGYFYQGDVPNLPSYQARWDILGMDYTADTASWNAIKSYGKPVIGHICPSSAAVSTALGFGAAGIMASGIQEGVPRSASSV